MDSGLGGCRVGSHRRGGASLQTGKGRREPLNKGLLCRLSPVTRDHLPEMACYPNSGAFVWAARGAIIRAVTVDTSLGSTSLEFVQELHTRYRPVDTGARGRVVWSGDRSMPIEGIGGDYRRPLTLSSTTMGNTSSNANTANTGKVSRSVPSTPSNGANHNTHKSMRTKKKSLELPDLAMLGISPRPPQPPPPSAPIPIPISPNPNPEAHRRPRDDHDDSRFTVSDLVIQPSTHIPLYPQANNRQPSYAKYDSNHSESSKDSILPSQPQEEQQSPFQQEVVHSTIPIALHKPLDHSMEDDVKRRHKKEEVPMKVYWRGGGKNVILIRAGDDNWKGRQPMEKEQVVSPEQSELFTHITYYLTLLQVR